MARIPTVGAGAVHTVQLSPGLRRIEKRRTRRAARREAAPVLAADRATLREVGGTYRSQVRSIKGATAMTDSALMQALNGGLGGLKGKYRQQVKSELLARLHDAAAIVPALVAEAQENRQKETGEARQQLRTDRASMLQSAASTFNQRLKELRTAGASALAEKQDAAKEASENPVSVPYAPTDTGREAEEAAAEAQKKVELALQEAKRLLTAYPEEHPHSDSEWAAFAGMVAKSEEVGPEAADKAVEIIRQHAAKRRSTGG